MKTLLSLAIALCLGCLSQAQTLPSNFVGAGLGFQNAGSPQMSGWLEIDKALPDVSFAGLTFHSYGGAATDYFGSSTSARVDTKLVVLHKAWFTAGTLQGAGAAFSANSIGGSFALGGWVTAGIGKLLNVPGARIGGVGHLAEGRRLRGCPDRHARREIPDARQPGHLPLRCGEDLVSYGPEHHRAA